MGQTHKRMIGQKTADWTYDCVCVKLFVRFGIVTTQLVGWLVEVKFKLIIRVIWMKQDKDATSFANKHNKSKKMRKASIQK